MPSDARPASPDSERSTVRRTSLALVLVAAAALALNCLLTSPPAFSDAHRRDTSLLKTVVSALALTGPSAERGAFPTPRGVDIRNLFFYTAAAALTLLAGLHLAAARRPPRLTLDDLLDLRARAAGPFFWWALMLLISAVTSLFAERRDICQGQLIIRLLHAAWWLPLAALLSPRHVRALLAALLAALTATAAVALWYHAARGAPGQPLSYPIGNSLWFGACLLPGLFVALALAGGFLIRRPAAGSSTPDAAAARPRLLGGWPATVALPAALSVLAVALYRTHARAAFVGLAAGIATLVFFTAPKKARPLITLAGVGLAFLGVLYAQNLAASGAMGRRAHSLRSRLHYEWPYALRLFIERPVGGHGEGAYAMRAGRFARDDQLEDPSVMASDEFRWTAHAHNEFLELLADIGLAGATAFLMALLMTLYWALRWCDWLRHRPAAAAERWLAIGLAAALVAMCVEEGASVALRHPGFPPIFLTVWAALWALVRRARPCPAALPEDARLNRRLLRAAGAAALLAAAALALFAVRDWRAQRAHFEAGRHLAAGDFDAAARAADFAGDHTLDPMRTLLARLLAVEARANAFAAALAASNEPLTEDQFAVGRRAWVGLARLNEAAPHFLRVSRLAWQLALNRTEAYHRSGDDRSAQDCYGEYLGALAESRRDEPFQIELVERLWRDRRDATLSDRLLWLRQLLRRRAIDDRFGALLRDFGRRPDSAAVIDGLRDLATRDSQRPDDHWQDPLAPETLRILALAADWSGRHDEAARLALTAEQMYARAGPRLFVARAAALLEATRYRLHTEPATQLEDKLRLLVRAHEILEGPLPESGDAALKVVLPGAPGHLRLLVLMAAGREAEAEAQLKRLRPDDPTPLSSQMSILYAGLAEQFSFMPEHADHALRWARRAAELDPDLAEPRFILAGLHLQAGEAPAALEAVRQFLDRAPGRRAAFAYLRQLEARWPGSPVWLELRRTIDDFPASQPTSAPATTSAPASRATSTPASHPVP